jgi:hypothetical protein
MALLCDNRGIMRLHGSMRCGVNLDRQISGGAIPSSTTLHFITYQVIAVHVFDGSVIKKILKLLD